MKKRFCLFSLVIVFALLCSASMTLSVNAEDEVETRSVKVDISVLVEASVAEHENVDLYFLNNETGIESMFTVSTDGGITDAPTIELPKGEYTLTKATLTSNPVIEFETYCDTLVVDDSEDIFCLMSLKSVISTEENAEVVQAEIDEINQSKEQAKTADFNQLLIALGLTVWLCWGISALVYTIKGKSSKNEPKRPYFKAKARIMWHIFVGLILAFFTGSIFGDGGFSWLFAIVGLGLPFGFAAVSIFYVGRDKEDDYYYREKAELNPEREMAKGGILYFILMIISLIFGVILTPVVLIYDIIQLIKTYNYYRKEKKKLKSFV